MFFFFIIIIEKIFFFLNGFEKHFLITVFYTRSKV